MGMRRWSAMATLVVIAQLVERSAQLSRNHPLHEAVDAINERGGPFVGLIMAFPLEEAAIHASDVFHPSSHFPSIQLAGRSFNIGTIRGVNVIYVMTGEQIINAGMTTQILYDAFDIVGVVHYGIAGSTNNSLRIGDVAIASHVAFTSSWDWLESGASEEGTVLNFGDYNVPTKGKNLLGGTKFTPVQLYSSSESEGNSYAMEELFWLHVDPTWLKIASRIKGAALQRCVNSTGTEYCLPEAPKVGFGVRGSTADVYLNNAAYRGYLWENFNVSFCDEESAAVVMTSLSNGKPSIVFRGISDYAGGSGVDQVSSLSTSMEYSLAAANALSLAVEFIQLVGGYNGGVVVE